MEQPAVSSPNPRVVIVGVGERFRRDDGCGPAVVRALHGRLDPQVELVERVSEPTELIDLWDRAALAVVVDAMRSEAPVGSLVRLEADGLDRAVSERSTSSHGLSVRDAYELGKALGRLPERLVLFLIEAGDVGRGERLSPAVQEGVAKAVAAITSELAGGR